MRACVTGFGIVDGLGYTPEQCYQNYMSSKDFIQTFETTYPINKGYRVDEAACILPYHVKPVTLTRNCKLSLHAVGYALQMANVPASSDVGVFFSDGPVHDGLGPLYNNERVPARKLVNSLPGAVSALLSITYGFEGIAVGAVSACATGLMTIEWAMNYIDRFDYLVVGATESSTIHYGSSYFTQIGALADKSMPFDKNRRGFVLGEGAGCLIIESEAKAKARGAKIYATLNRVGFANDTSSLTAPDLTGRGMKRAIANALEYAGVDKVDSINAHATSTVIGDQTEYNALKAMGFDVPIYSCKSKFGHAINAASMIEAVYSIMFGMHGHTGYTANLVDPLADDPNLVTSPVYIDKDKTLVLNNAFGFGGRCASQVMEVYRTT